MKAGLVGVVAVFAAGCFIKPDAPDPLGGGGDPDAGVDGKTSPSADSSTQGTCTLHDDFNAVATGCGDWANNVITTGATTITHGPATLAMSAAGGGGSVRCVSKRYIDIINGVTVQILSVPQEANSTVRFEVVDLATSTRVALVITGGASPTAGIQLGANPVTSMKPFAPATMKMWKLRREDSTFATPAITSRDVVLDYLDSGGMWNELGRAGVPLTSFTSTSVHLFASFTSTSAIPTTFENLDGCK